MHRAAFEWVEWAVDRYGPFANVVEFGSLDINGSVRNLFHGDYVGLDLVPGPNVDMVLDAGDYHDTGHDCVVCCEVAEHHPFPCALVPCAARALAPGGVFIFTAAGPTRPTHSAIDGGHLRSWEHYANIEPSKLEGWLGGSLWESFVVDEKGADVRAVAIRSTK